MKKKNFLNWNQVTAFSRHAVFFMMCLLGAAVFTACSDDDDDTTDGQEKRSDVDPLDTDDARTAFRWLCVLANADGFDSKWQSKTWEPTIGQAQESSQYSRLVVVEDLNEAKEHFANLADMEVAQIGKKQTVSGGAAGSMTWTESAAGAQNLAVVEVNSRILPHLQKLIYCTFDQVGKNASITGTAHYRFGDVICDSEGYYWVCVRPSFAPKKDDSHWINIYNASTKGNYLGGVSEQSKRPMLDVNLFDKYNKVPKYNNKTILLPTKLPYDRKHIYNLCNLIWAMLQPNLYELIATANNKTGLGGFNLDLNGKNFVSAVAKYWDQVPEGQRYTLWEMIFGLSRDEMSKMEEMNFFYQGYRWWWGETPDFWIYRSTGYMNGITGSESDDMVTNINVVTNGFDIRRYTGDPEADRNAGFEQQFTRNSSNEVTKGYWVVRYKKGEDLCAKGSVYDPYNKISGCEDVYTFNGKTHYKVGADSKQETDTEVIVDESNKIPKVGDVVGANGKFYDNQKAAQNEGTEAVAMVACVNNATPVEAGTDYYGLAIALESVENGEFFPWEASFVQDNTCPGEGGMVNPEQRAQLANVMNGLAVTQRLASSTCNANHNHSIAKTVYNGEEWGIAITDAQERSKFSRWFIPSSGQYILACKNMGFTWNGTEFDENGQWKWEHAIGWTEMANLDNSQMTCTTSTGEEKSYFTFKDHSIDLTKMSLESSVRPMLAFKKI